MFFGEAKEFMEFFDLTQTH